MKRQRRLNGQFQTDFNKKLYPLKVLVLSLGFTFGVAIPSGSAQKMLGWDVEAKVLPTTGAILVASPTPTITPTPAPISESESVLIEKAVDEFLPKHKSEALMIMHCLAHRESGHGSSKAHGDNGLAGGPFQFHEATWSRMRSQMGESESSRYDFKEAARTTAWAIANGRAREWGPIYRSAKGSNFANCQVPSWYK